MNINICDPTSSPGPVQPPALLSSSPQSSSSSSSSSLNVRTQNVKNAAINQNQNHISNSSKHEEMKFRQEFQTDTPKSPEEYSDIIDFPVDKQIKQITPLHEPISDDWTLLSDSDFIDFSVQKKSVEPKPNGPPKELLDSGKTLFSDSDRDALYAQILEEQDEKLEDALLMQQHSSHNLANEYFFLTPPKKKGIRGFFRSLKSSHKLSKALKKTDIENANTAIQKGADLNHIKAYHIVNLARKRNFSSIDFFLSQLSTDDRKKENGEFPPLNNNVPSIPNKLRMKYNNEGRLTEALKELQSESNPSLYLEVLNLYLLRNVHLQMMKCIFFFSVSNQDDMVTSIFIKNKKAEEYMFDVFNCPDSLEGLNRQSIESLVKLGLSTDTVLGAKVNLLQYSISTFLKLIIDDGKLEKSEEYFLLVKFLLENKARPNAIFLPDEHGPRVTILDHLIKYVINSRDWLNRPELNRNNGINNQLKKLCKVMADFGAKRLASTEEEYKQMMEILNASLEELPPPPYVEDEELPPPPYQPPAPNSQIAVAPSLRLLPGNEKDPPPKYEEPLKNDT